MSVKKGNFSYSRGAFSEIFTREIKETKYN